MRYINNIEEKKFLFREKKLEQIMWEITRQDLAVAFSGGVDSSLLLKLAVKYAREHGTKVYAVTANTELHPRGDVAVAKKVAEEAGAQHFVVDLKELDEAGIRHNPVNRCYLCKKYLFETMRRRMQQEGVSVFLEGTNADDLKVYRPGIRAIEELGIKSPLMEAGFAKEDVRKLAEIYGISVAKRPSAPCLATRFPYGDVLSYENMRKVERAEDYLKTFGFYNVRLRVHGELARIEIDGESLEKVFSCREEICRRLKKLGYDYITLDLEGFRSGSMDENLDGLNKKRGTRNCYR